MGEVTDNRGHNKQPARPACTQRTARRWGGRCSGGLLVEPAARGRVGGARGGMANRNPNAAAWPRGAASTSGVS